MRIRAATVADLASIVRCANLAFASFAGLSDKQDVKLEESLRSQILEGSIQLMCDGAGVVGYISLWPTADQMFVDTLAVLPKHHRQGLGTQLLAFADNETLRLGRSSVNLFTKATMADNLVFYKRRGYRETGRCDDDGFCRVFFSKSIRRKAA
jgi:ribosomal protein S18 acetylase RimI-like enzyme